MEIASKVISYLNLLPLNVEQISNERIQISSIELLFLLFQRPSQSILFNIIIEVGIIYNQVRIKMGLLGNKDTKTPAKESAPKAVQNPPPAVVTPESSDFKSTLEGWIGQTKGFFNSWTSNSCSWCESEQMREISRARKEFSNQFCHPLGDFYRDLPLQITSWKLKQTERYTLKQRLLGLQGLTLLVAVSSLTAKRDLGLSKRFLLSIRNSATAFLFGGLFIVPEIYNPLIKSDF